jgi:hypothetical protein
MNNLAAIQQPGIIGQLSAETGANFRDSVLGASESAVS